MSPIDLQEIRDYVRSYLDLDTLDIADTLIDRWVSEGTVKVQRLTRRWPFYEYEGTLSTTAGTHTYSLPVKHIEAIDHPDKGALRPVDHSEAMAAYLSPGATSVGDPDAFSVWADQLRLWPTPNAVLEMRVRGYREPERLGHEAGAEPDVPEDFHEAILSWVMAKAFTHQMDPELAAVHERQFNETLAAIAAHEMATPVATPLIFGGGRGRAWRSRTPFGPLRLPRWD